MITARPRNAIGRGASKSSEEALGADGGKEYAEDICIPAGVCEEVRGSRTEGTLPEHYTEKIVCNREMFLSENEI
jgi:hypothetical protein